MTPLQISNILDQIGGLDGLDLDKDLDILDGYDELEDWAQKKVKDALVNGHVDDEDWKGVSYHLICISRLGKLTNSGSRSEPTRPEGHQQTYSQEKER